MMENNFHIKERIHGLSDEPVRLIVLIRNKSALHHATEGCPPKINFDNTEWKFIGLGDHLMEDAENFQTTAIYIPVGSQVATPEYPVKTTASKIIENNINYWVVGAKYGSLEAGYTDMYDTFISRGYWELGWDEGEKPLLDNLFNQIRVGDRLAIKTKKFAASTMHIRAFGIVTDIENITGVSRRVYINWVMTEKDFGACPKMVPIAGCMGSIHGPFPKSDWRNDVFSI